MIMKNIWNYLLRQVRRFLASACGYNIAFVDKYKHNPFTWVIVSKDPSWYYKPIHLMFRVIWLMLRLLKKGLGYLLLILMGLWAITWVTTVISFIVEPIRMQLRRSKWEIADEKHGIEYHPFRSVRTVEEVKELIANWKINAETSKSHREIMKSDYTYTLGDWFSINFKKTWDFEAYKVDRLYMDKKIIRVIFGEKKFWKDDKESHIVAYKSDYVSRLREKVYSYVVSVYPKCSANLNADLGDFSDDDKWKEGIDLLSYWIREILTMSSIKFVKISDKKGWKAMDSKDIEETIKDIEYEELSSN